MRVIASRADVRYMSSSTVTMATTMTSIATLVHGFAEWMGLFPFSASQVMYLKSGMWVE